MRKLLVLVSIVGFALPATSLAASKPPFSQPPGQLVLKGVVSDYVPASATENGSVEITVRAGKLGGQTILLAVTPRTIIRGQIENGHLVSAHAAPQSLFSGPQRLVATELVDLAH